MKITNISFVVIKGRLPEFKDWLRAHGCEIQELSNEYELVRFKSNIGVGVLYAGQKGLSANVPFVADAISLFIGGLQWKAGKVTATKRSPSPKRKKELLLRDGDRCFYCGEQLKSDITEEHLVSVSQRGYNRLDNIVLAHFKCNELASHRSLVEKIQLRDEMKWGVEFKTKKDSGLDWWQEAEINRDTLPTKDKKCSVCNGAKVIGSPGVTCKWCKGTGVG